MTIDISIVDRMTQRLEKAPSGKWYARTYDGAAIVYEDEIAGYTGGTIPSEINDVYASQRTAVLLGGRQVVSGTNPLTGGSIFSGPSGDISVVSAMSGRRGACIGDSTTDLGEILGRTFLPVTVTGVQLESAELSTASGNATLAWNATSRTLTWTAPGDTPGLPVEVTNGIFKLESGTTGNSVVAKVTGNLLPPGNVSENIASGTVNWQRPVGSWIGVADALTFGRFEFDNYGIAGDTLANVTARYDQMLSSNPSFVADLIGTNDIGALTPAQITSSRVANWKKAIGRGIPVIAILITPRFAASSSDATANYSAAKQNTLTGANQALIKAARALSGVYIVDGFSPAAVQSTGFAKAGYTGDGLHFSGGLGYEVGRQVAAILDVLFPAEIVRPNFGPTCYYDATYRPEGNLMTSDQGGFASTGGTAGTGITAGTGLALGWNSSRLSGTTFVATANKFTDPEGGPDWQEFDCSGATADGETIRAYPYSISTNIAVGDLVNHAVEFWVVGTGCYGVYADLNHTGGPLNGSGSRAWQLKDVVQGLRDGEKGLIRGIPNKLQAGVTSILPVVYLQSKAGAAFKVRFRLCETHKIVG